MRARPAGPAAPLILLVDDAEDLRTVLTGVLEAAGFRVVTAAGGHEALRSVFASRPDLVVLDLGLPDLDGLEVLTRIRDMTDLPVLVLTARSVDRDKLKGFRLGADDYVTKPFSNAELTARITALLRRAGRSRAAASVIQDGPLVIDVETQAVTLAGAPVTLTPTDWSLLIAFITHPGQVLSQAQLLELAWKDPVGVGPERVKFAVQRLRRRMGWQPPARSPIESVRGFGYRYRGRLAGSLTPGRACSRLAPWQLPVRRPGFVRFLSAYEGERHGKARSGLHLHRHLPERDSGAGRL